MKNQIFLLFVLAGLAGDGLRANPTEAEEPHPVLLIVFDGLRPDYIDPDLMPNLYAFGERGVVAERHHAVFPSVTWVNAPSIATGATPGRHGLLHNTIYLPEFSPEPFSSGNVDLVQQANASIEGGLLTASSLGEIMDAGGKRLWVAGSTGSATVFLLNHRLSGHGAASAGGFMAPESSREQILSRMPAPPSRADPPYREGNRWAVDLFLEVGLDEFQPDAAIFWIADPDFTTHRKGVGAPETLEAVRHVDEEFGRLLEGIRDRGLADRMNIFVTTDHGFSTLTHELDPAAAVAASGVDPEKYLVVPSRGKVYVKDRDPAVIRRIVETLQRDPAVGAVFTRSEAAGGVYGAVPGTLSLESVDYEHERSPDILFDAAWTDQENEYGFPGSTSQTRYPANHGTSSPYDLQILLLAAGPDIKQGVRSEVPTGNIDLAPTILHLLNLPRSPSMQGRVLHELLRGGPPPEGVAVGDRLVTASIRLEEPQLDYEVSVRRLSVGETEYVHSTETRRRR